jgi:hypothetical protein
MPLHPSDDETRQRYMALYKDEGIDVTLTEIHNEIGRLEPKTFDGGFNKERFNHVQGLRFLAQELWNIKLREQTTKAYGEKEANNTFGTRFGKTDER